MLDLIQEFWYFITHLNESLPAFVADYGMWIYGLLFLIIFVETGLVVMPFLPGDSLLFVAGSLAAGANPSMNFGYLFVLLFLAAVLGDNLNYWIGRYFGSKVVKWRLFGRDLVKAKDLDKTHAYFEKYGVKTIIIARFVPIVRTITPFVAGVGAMDYRKKFLPFDIVGGLLWIGSMLTAGYLVGNSEIVQRNFHYVVFGIIGLSVLPMVIEFFRHRKTASE
ncbi:MAG: VTT domain-containing protein [Flavobacteriales bacterium]|nr:VTT domain-containing protein [Flavobacteriales bacterium]